MAATDLSDLRTLAAITDTVNAAKSDQEPPDGCRPPLGGRLPVHRHGAWIAIKAR